MNILPTYTIHIPEYQSGKEPNHELVGAKVDDFIKQHFLGQYIAVRCLGSEEHPGKTVDEMITIIKTLGHDRYDPNRPGDRYENNENKKIDIFAFDYQVETNTKIFSVFTWPFYHWGIESRGKPIKIDIIIIYDPTKLEVVEFSYPGREHEGMRSDGFVFKDEKNKAGALKAIIKLT